MSTPADQIRSWLEEEEEPQARTTVGAASYTDPDQYANDRRIAKDGNVPIAVVQDDREEVKRRVQVDKVDYKKLARDHSAVAKWLENPENAQLAHDDIENLQRFDTEANRDWWEVDSRTMEGWGDSYMIGTGKMYDEAMINLLEEQRVQAPQLEDLMNPLEAAGQAARYLGQRLMMDENEARLYNEALDEKIEAHKQNLQFAQSEIARLTPQDLTTMEEGLRGAATMGADMLTGLAATYVTRGRVNPTLGFLTGKTYLDSYGQAVASGIDHETAKRYGAIDGGIELATEKIPLGMLEKIFGEIGKGGIKTSIKKFMMAEVTGEQIATATQTINAYLHGLDEELAQAKSFDDIIRIQGERQAVTFISTLVGGGGMSSAAKGIDYLANRERRAMQKSIQEAGKRVNSEQDQVRLDNLFSLAQSAKVNERAADVYKDFVDNVAPAEKVYMNAEVLEELDDVPDYVINQIDGSNGTIEIPMSDFIRDFANDEARLAIVRPHIKTREGLLTQDEMDQQVSSTYVENMLQRAADAKETNEASKRIFDEVRDQIVATGRQGDYTARQSATLIPAMVTTQYENLKAQGVEVTLEELYQDIGFRVAGPGEVRSETAEFLEQGERLKVRFPTLGSFFADTPDAGLDDMTGTRADTTSTSVLMNPTQNEVMAFAGREIPSLRMMVDRQGNTYVWNAEEAIHSQVLKGLGLERDDLAHEMSDNTIAPGDFETWTARLAEPEYLAQQNFGDIRIPVTAVDEAENAVSFEQPAQELWDEQQQRLNMVEQLRDCLNA